MAKFRDEENSLTQTGSVLGTPAFAAPEQLSGNSANARSELGDVYSLGAVLYFLLTGEPPFAADSVLALVQKVQSDEPQHPAKLRDNIPTDLSAICLKAMEKEPSRRYDSAWELKADLERFIRNEPTLARPLTRLGKVQKWYRRNPVVSLLGSLFFAALLAGFSATYYQWRAAQSNLAEVVRQRDRSDLLLEKAEESIDAMLNSTASALENIPSMTDVRRQMLEDALKIQKSILELDEGAFAVQETIQSLERVAKIQQELGRFADAKSTTAEAIELLESLPETGGKAIDESSLQRRMVDLEMRLGNIDGANVAAKKLKLLTGQHGDRSQDGGYILSEVRSMKVLGQLAERSGRVDEAEEYFAKAIAIGSELHAKRSGPHKVDASMVLVSAWNSLGIIQRAKGELAAASESYQVSLDLNAELIEHRPADRLLIQKSATTSHNLANLLFQQRNYSQAREHYQRAVDLLGDLKNKFPSVYLYHQRISSAMSGLALVQKLKGQPLEAKDTLVNSIAALEKSAERFGATEENLVAMAHATGSLASIESLLNDYESADESFRMAIKINRELVEMSPTNASYRYKLSLVQGNEAGSLTTRGEFKTAVDLLKEAISEGEKAVEIAPGVARYRSSLNFIQGKMLEAMVGAELWQKANLLVSELMDKQPPARRLLDIARSLSDGVEQLQQNSADAAETEAIKQRMFEVLELALETGLSRDLIDPTEFKTIFDDERFEKLLEPAK